MRKQTTLTYTVTAKEIGEWIAATIAARAGLRERAIDYRLIEWENGDATWSVTTTEDDEPEVTGAFGGIFEAKSGHMNPHGDGGFYVDPDDHGDN